MADQKIPKDFDLDLDLSVEELEHVAGGADEDLEGPNTSCTEVNIYQCGKTGTKTPG